MVLLLAGCASYQSPTEGELAFVEMRSVSYYPDVQVHYCLDAECEDVLPVGELVGAEFLETWKEAPWVLEDYADKHRISVNVHANEASTFRFTTIKTVSQRREKPRRRSSIQHVLGTVYIKTWDDYSGDRKTVTCRTSATLEPETGARILIEHEHDLHSEECILRVSALE